MSNNSRMVAVVPAHNEQEVIAGAIYSLFAQTSPPDEIVVVLDNCTDGTERVCHYLGVRTFVTRDNRNKKAGALNQYLEQLVPTLRDHDLVLVMDADSYLHDNFLRVAESRLRGTSKYGAIGGTFAGRGGGGFVGDLQRNEYARYARDVRRRKGDVLCLTGTATVFRVGAMRDVRATREDGGVYDISALTEDFEITLALKHLGYRVVSPKECTLVTEVMESWRDLWSQRLRWKRGAVECLVRYGWTRHTWSLWLRQLWTLIGVGVTLLYLTSLAYSLSVDGRVVMYPLALGVMVIFAVERAITVRRRGWRQALMGSLLVFEMPYDIYLQVVHLMAYARSVVRSERTWS